MKKSRMDSIVLNGNNRSLVTQFFEELWDEIRCKKDEIMRNEFYFFIFLWRQNDEKEILYWWKKYY